MSVINDSTLLDSVAPSEASAYDAKHLSNFKDSHEPLIKPNSPPMSWRDAAKLVQPKPRNPYPRIHDFERSLLPTLRTLRAHFSYGLCPHCSRPMIDAVLPQHISQCEKREMEKPQKLNEASKPSPVTEEPVGGILTKKRKRGADELVSRPAAEEMDAAVSNKGAIKLEAPAQNNSENRTGATKKTKINSKLKSAKAKVAKAPKTSKQSKEKLSAVFHPDKNCGVIMPNGQPCMRSLTCKQHSMGAKRAVTGRSSLYDVLLSNYHHQHQIKQAQLTAHAAHTAQMEDDQLHENMARENPEREVHQVLEGVTRVYCAPLAQSTILSTSIRSNNFRLREMLSAALLPRRLPPTGDVLYGRSLAFKPEAPDQFSYVRSQAVQQAIFLTQMQQRHSQLKKQQDSGVSNPVAPSNNHLGASAHSAELSGQSHQPAQSQPQSQSQMQNLSSRILAQQRARQFQIPK